MEGRGVISPPLAAVPDRQWASPGPRRVLHVGCGGIALPEWLQGSVEIRLDIDAIHQPDIVADMTSLGVIGSYDLVYCAHALEHVSASDAARTLAEFHRVLMPGGCAIIFVPDLEGVEPTEDILYVSPAGPISGLDMLYGFQPFVVGRPYMQHRTGFIRRTLDQAMRVSGFERVLVRRIGDYNLMGVGVKA